MLESEKFAIAAHLHVVLRRTNGRVTDVEWMVRNPDYAREVIRVARTESNPDLLALADKLEAALLPPAAPSRPSRSSAAVPADAPNTELPSSDFAASGFEPGSGRRRYVGTLR
ncbi:MAG TPA: hypothetical protein VEQ09_11550 [Aquabacterium sp.]|nr:hypothetical protein [Aquabacterium sp.]